MRTCESLIASIQARKEFSLALPDHTPDAYRYPDYKRQL